MSKPDSRHYNKYVCDTPCCVKYIRSSVLSQFLFLRSVTPKSFPSKFGLAALNVAKSIAKTVATDHLLPKLNSAAYDEPRWLFMIGID